VFADRAGVTPWVCILPAVAWECAQVCCRIGIVRNSSGVGSAIRARSFGQDRAPATWEPLCHRGLSASAAGNTLFDQVFGPIGDTANQVTGTVAFTWFNLATFRGGSGTAPVTPVGPPAEYRSGASSPARTGTGQIVAFAAPT